MDRQPAIRDLAAIGDCHGAALVAKDGTIAWATLGRFDADPVFLSLLDEEKGGFLSTEPVVPFETERSYVPGTNVLETTFETASGRALATDFMPVGRAAGTWVHDYVTLSAPHWIVRWLEGVSGDVRFRVRYRPSVAFAARPARLERRGCCIVADGGEGPSFASEVPVAIEGDHVSGEFTLARGQRVAFVVARDPVRDERLLRRVPHLLAITRAFFREWSAYCRYRGPYRDAVLRSALALKLMTYSPTGAIVAAPTTSLPEAPGGERNWDYRACWLRDASFTLYALANLGYAGEARDFVGFLLDPLITRQRRLGVLYGIEREASFPEEELGHLAGYRGSRPVRRGNEAIEQIQLDVLGEIVDFALLYQQLGGKLDAYARSLAGRVARGAARRYLEKGHGLWEMRSRPRQHVFGLLECWVACDRALRLSGPDEDLVRARDEIMDLVRTRGVAPDGSLRLALDEDETDAALLLVPVLGVPIPRETFERTVAKIERTLLLDRDLVRRYRVDDGLPGHEGAFLACSFWRVDALLALGRADEARATFERLLARANDVGLFSEELDPRTGDFLGNFPQAFTHLALVNSASNIELVRRRGPGALWRAHADRARLEVQWTSGWRGWLASLRQTGRVLRVTSSWRSVMPHGWGVPDGEGGERRRVA